MRICFLGKADSIHLKRWVRFFVERGHEVHVITHDLSSIDGATMHRLPAVLRKPVANRVLGTLARKVFGPKHTDRFVSMGSSFVLGAWMAPRILHKIKPDVVHAHFITNYGFFAARSGFSPLVMTAWGSDVFLVPEVVKGMGAFTGYVLRRADLITADGDNTIKRMVELGAPADRIKKIHFGIDTRVFSPDKKDPGFRRRLGLPDNAVVVISLRALDPIYNVQLLAKAAPLATGESREVYFVIVGRGSETDSVKRMVQEAGVADRVVFAPFLSNEDFPVYVASSDIYVSTSLADSGLAASTGEAMASGLPVLITETGASKDWVRDGENGRIIPSDDPEPLARAIADLAGDPAKRKAWGRINRELIIERQDYSREMARAEELCLELIGRSGVGRNAHGN